MGRRGAFVAAPAGAAGPRVGVALWDRGWSRGSLGASAEAKATGPI